MKSFVFDLAASLVASDPAVVSEMAAKGVDLSAIGLTGMLHGLQITLRGCLLDVGISAILRTKGVSLNLQP